jgi:uncharacterized protein YjbI with pentapeptide repeats
VPTAVSGPKPPRLPTRFTTPVRFGGEEVYQHIHVRGAALGRADLTHIEVVGSRLERLNIAFADASHTVLRDCVVNGGDAANLTARSASLTRISFDGVRMTGVQLIDCVLVDVTFHEVKLDLAALRFTKFRKVEFRDCNLTRADFANADLRGARFVRCDLSGAQFSHAQAEGARFENCWLEGVGGVAHLRGASVSSDDLVSLSRVLAAALGIEIVA